MLVATSLALPRAGRALGADDVRPNDKRQMQPSAAVLPHSGIKDTDTGRAFTAVIQGTTPAFYAIHNRRGGRCKYDARVAVGGGYEGV
jgi:hypothetical protein